MILPFYKYEGLKNDFVILDLRKVQDEKLLGAAQDINVHRKLCERHSGVGADGVLVLQKCEDPNVVGRMVITNSDGSQPEMCGNGIRCVAQFLFDNAEIRSGESFRVASDAGHKEIIVTDQGVRVDMGLARPLVTAQGKRLWGNLGDWVPDGISSTKSPQWAVDMGNPHLVLRSGTDFKQIQEDGPAWARHPFFTQGVNVGFSEQIGPFELKLMVWERGAGATWACGTGACAAAVAWFDAEGWDQPVQVNLPGGTLVIEIHRQGDAAFQVFMTGPARQVYSGRLSLSSW